MKVECGGRKRERDEKEEVEGRGCRRGRMAKEDVKGVWNKKEWVKRRTKCCKERKKKKRW